MEHLQQSPGVHLREAGGPIQWPKMKEDSCVTGRTAPEGSDHHEHLPASHKLPPGN